MMKTEHIVDGYTVISGEHARTIWDADDLLATLAGEATDMEIEHWVAGFRSGLDRGRAVGRRQLQHELRRLIGAA